jgi:hypothetical protein
MYKVVFLNHNKVYELYANAVYQSEMYGFVEVEDFVFGEKNQVIVDPGVEKLRSEFSGVERTYIPMHHILRIDEVEKEGTGKIREASPDDKVAVFPLGGRAPKTDTSPDKDD